MSQLQSQGDVLLVPRGLYGHTMPCLHLTRWLLQRGLTCTLLLEEQGRLALERKENDSLLESQGLHVEWVPTYGGKDVQRRQIQWQRACEPYFERRLRDRSAGGRGPICVVVDQFGGWTREWATKLKTPRYVFVASPAIFAYWCSMYSSLIRKDRLLDRIHEDPILDLPGAPELRLSESPSFSLSSPEVYTEHGDTYLDAAGILINTFYDLEASVIDGFDSQLRTRGRDCEQKKGSPQPRVLPVGPLELFGNVVPDIDPTGSVTDSSCVQWLNSRPRASVLYIAVGSMGNNFAEAHGHELAKALEATQVSFLWILIPPRDGFGESVEVSSLLPPGFEYRTRDQGLVHPFFSPQPQILAHPATRAFLTHCGWNSSLESICRGVPLVGWPSHRAEQNLCFRVLEQAGAIAGIADGIAGVPKGGSVASAELERGLRTWVMDGPGRTKLATRVLELQRQAGAAVASGGSSYQNLESFFQEIQP